MASTMVIVKAELAGELRRTSFDPVTVTYRQLCDRLQDLFHVAGPLKLTYIDEENDRVTIAGDMDIRETVRVAQQLNNVLKLKIELLADGVNTTARATVTGEVEEEPWEIARLAESQERTLSDSDSSSTTTPTPQKQTREGIKEDEDELNKLAAMMSGLDVKEKETEKEKDSGEIEREEAHLGKQPQQEQGAPEPTESKKENERERETGKTDTSSVASSTFDIQFCPLSTEESATSVSSSREGLPNYESNAPPIPTKIGAGAGHSPGGSTEQQAQRWIDQLINEGQFHRLILQTRLEHEISTLANDPRVAATVSEVYERLKATAQFTEQQLAQVKSYLYEALNRIIGSGTSEGGVPRAERFPASHPASSSNTTDIVGESEQEQEVYPPQQRQRLPPRGYPTIAGQEREESFSSSIPKPARESSKEEQCSASGSNDQSRSPGRRRVIVDYEPRPCPVPEFKPWRPPTEHTGEYPPPLPASPFPAMDGSGYGGPPPHMVPTEHMPMPAEQNPRFHQNYTQNPQFHMQGPQHHHPMGLQALNLNSLEPLMPPPLPPLPPLHHIHTHLHPFPVGAQLPPPHQHTYSPFPLHDSPQGHEEENEPVGVFDFPQVSIMDRQRYAQQLETLEAMGFGDVIQNVRLLRRADGDVRVVANWLINS